MNKTIKILLLVVAILLSIGGIMYYYKTVVEPPRNLKFSNQYVAEIKRDIALLDDQTNGKKNDSLYVSIFDEITHFSKEDCIDKNERDVLMDDFTSSYIPKFINACHSKFESSVWNTSDHDEMLSRIKELRSLTVNGGAQKVIQGEYSNSMDEIERIIDQYNTALSIASRTEYRGSSSAKSIIAEASRYASMKYLSNCYSLVTNLEILPKKLEASHFGYLSNRVYRQLYYWEIYSKDDYETLSNKVYEEINEYDSNASEIYGSRQSVAGLKGDAGKYYNEAMKYYKNKE